MAGGTGRVQHVVHTAGEELAHLGAHIALLAVNEVSSAVIPGLLQFFGQDVAGHQILYTQQAHKLQVCKTHRAAAKHYHGVLGLDTEIADVGEHLTEGDDHSGVHGVQIVVQHRLSKGAVGSAAGPGGFGIAHHSVLTQRAPAGAQPRQVFRVRIHKG